MKLYLISQDVNVGCDTYNSAVVCATDEDTARRMDPETWRKCNFKKRYYSWCPTPESVTVQYIGDAAPGIALGVICASFNAG